MGKLAGRVAVITGVASGIGAASVRLFVQEGARVVIADIDDDAGPKLESELGSNVKYAKTDASRESDIRAVIELAVRWCGRLDCLPLVVDGGLTSGRMWSDAQHRFDMLRAAFSASAA
jgi:NAD(P)-dependent dehydrogenase (short-subunit alcohol dehydrogenase family)